MKSEMNLSKRVLPVIAFLTVTTPRVTFANLTKNFYLQPSRTKSSIAFQSLLPSLPTIQEYPNTFIVQPPLFCSHSPLVPFALPSINSKRSYSPEGIIGSGSVSRLRRLAKQDEGYGGGDEDVKNTVEAGDGDQKRAITSARAGGRSKKRINNDGESVVGNKLNFVKTVLTLVVAATVLRSLLGFLSGFFTGGNDRPSYVYYQSTIYETSSISADGKVERIRKESVKSNIPSLISGDRVIQGDMGTGSGGSRKSSYLLRDY